MGKTIPSGVPKKGEPLHRSRESGSELKVGINKDKNQEANK